MVDPSVAGFQPANRYETIDDLKKELDVPTDRRMFAIAQALHDKVLSVAEIHEITKIDHWFLRRLENIVKCWDELENFSVADIGKELLTEATNNQKNAQEEDFIRSFL